MHDADTRAVELTLDYLRTASPEQRHVYAARSNYDGNREALRLLVDDPALDEEYDEGLPVALAEQLWELYDEEA